MKWVRQIIAIDLTILGLLIVVDLLLGFASGGVAFNGKVESGQHLVVNHGRCIPVSAVLYWLQRSVEYAVVMTAVPFALVVLFDLATKRKFDLHRESNTDGVGRQ